MKVRFLIIGAGPCGLGAAYRLRELGEHDYLVLEHNDWVGGLAASFTDELGFTWDIGGHVQFSHYTYFDEVMDLSLGRDGWIDHERESWVWIKDRFVPYPFQNNIRFLPRESLWRCLKGVVQANLQQTKKRPNNFREWILRVFGEGIAEEFMLPYNFKVWAYQPEFLTYQWIGQRVAVVDLQRVLENIIFERNDVSWGPNNKFRFPKWGGTGAIWRAVGKLVGEDKIVLKATVTALDARAKRVRLADGREIAYERVLSTVPLDRLAVLTADVPDALRRTAGNLLHSTSNIVGVGIKGAPRDELSTKCWMYFPESNCPFYRVTLFSKYSPNNVPDINHYYSLMTETSESTQKPVNRERLVYDTIEGLLNTKLIASPQDVVTTWSFRADYGYPIPSLKRDRILATVMPALEELGVYSRGRFGGWKYEVGNQDHTFMQGVEWVNWQLQGQPETTFTTGDVVRN